MLWQWQWKGFQDRVSTSCRTAGAETQNYITHHIGPRVKEASYWMMPVQLGHRGMRSPNKQLLKQSYIHRSQLHQTQPKKSVMAYESLGRQDLAYVFGPSMVKGYLRSFIFFFLVDVD